MGHAQQLRDLLAPLGVYRWEGPSSGGSCRARGRPWIRWRRNWKTPSRRCTWLPPRGGAGPDFVPPGPGAGEASVEDLRATAAALLRIGGGSFTLAAMNDTLFGSRPARPGGGRRGPLEAEGDLPQAAWESPPGLPRSRPGWRTSCPATYRWSTSSGGRVMVTPHPPKGDGGVTMEKDTSSGAQVTDRPPNFVQ